MDTRGDLRAPMWTCPSPQQVFPRWRGYCSSSAHSQVNAGLDRGGRKLTDGKQTPDMEVRFDTTMFAVGP
jgi:hypothetical protein